MPKFSLRAVLALGSLVALAGVTFAFPSWPEAVGLDLWSVPNLHSQIDLEERRAAQLQKFDQALMRRLAAKQAVVEELLDGMVDLDDAAEQFLALNRSCAEGVNSLRINYRGATDEERCSKQVVAFVEASAESDSRVTPELLAKLRARVGHDAR